MISSIHISKRVFFSFFFMIALCSPSKLFAQIGVLEMDNAIFLQKEHYELNCMITATSLNGNYEVARQLLSKENPRSKVYRTGKAMLLYNIQGRDKSLQYLDSIGKRISSSKEELAYMKALVSISTSNSDDFEYYLDQLDSTSGYWMRLKFKENDRKIPREYGKKEQEFTVKRINRVLSGTNLSNSDRLLLELKKIDLLYDISYDDAVRYDKAQGLLNLWKKYPEQFDTEELLSSLRRCDSPDCEKVKASLRTKEVP